MPEQLALDIVAEDTDTQSPESVDLAVSVLRAHDGDAVAAIRSLLEDADFLRDQLVIASEGARPMSALWPATPIWAAANSPPGEPPQRGRPVSSSQALRHRLVQTHRMKSKAGCGRSTRESGL